MTFFSFNTLSEKKNAQVIDSMHTLRCKIFHSELGWQQGLIIKNKREYDEYDNEKATYIVDADQHATVQAAARIIPTTAPYMIADHYPEYVYNKQVPHQDNVYEISRFCANVQDRYQKNQPLRAACLTVSLIEYGLQNKIEYYIALTNLNIKAMIRRIGWDPAPIGDIKETPDGVKSIVCRYTISEEMLEHINKRHDIRTSLLTNFDVWQDTRRDEGRDSITLPASGSENCFQHGSPFTAALFEQSHTQRGPSYV